MSTVYGNLRAQRVSFVYGFHSIANNIRVSIGLLCARDPSYTSHLFCLCFRTRSGELAAMDKFRHTAGAGYAAASHTILCIDKPNKTRKLIEQLDRIQMDSRKPEVLVRI